jgi:hypothetical protein
MASKQKKAAPEHDDSTKAELIRRYKANPFLFIGTLVILVIVIVAFVFVPAIVPSAGGMSADLNFGSYNKIPINFVPGNYFSQVQQSIAQNRQNSMDDSNYQMMSYQIWREAFEETVVHTGILDEMKHAGFVAPADAVDREMALLPIFQENGRFSTARYRSMLSNERMALWRQVQDSIASNHYREDLTGLRIPSTESAFVGAMGSPQRTFDLAAFNLNNYPEPELKGYVESNVRLFDVTHLSRITINSSEREARQVLTSIQNGTTTFEDAAKTNSQDSYADRSGDMGIKMAYELVTEISEEADRTAVLNLAKGDTSPIYKVTSGWAFFRAEDSVRPVDTNDSTLLEKIRGYVMSFERGRVEDYFLSEADSFVTEVKESGFDEAVAARGLTKQTFGPLPVNYGDLGLFPSLSFSRFPELSGASTNEAFWKTAFSTPLNTPSSSLVLGDYVVILYPVDETPADETDTGNIDMYYSYWISNATEQNIHSYFLTNEKFQDKFLDTFLKYFWTN